MSVLRSLLAEAREQGFLGDQPIQRQLEHAAGFVDVCQAVIEAATASPSGHPSDPGDPGRPGHPVARLLDLGAGGGLPGLVLATSMWPFPASVVLLDGSARRTEWLRYAVEELGLAATVEIIGERAEVAGRMSSWRQAQTVVVARSFGRPAVTAECAAPLLAVGGALVVSEPPSGEVDGVVERSVAHPLQGEASELTDRWPSDRIAELGFGRAVEWRARGYRYAVLPMERLCPDRYPRRNGIPSKRPLF